MSDIYVYGTEFGGVWLRCNRCGTSNQSEPARMGIRFDTLQGWVKNHVCVKPQSKSQARRMEYMANEQWG